MNGQEPAFPTIEHGDPQISTTPGITIRDYFAAKAMQAIISVAHNIKIGTSYPDQNMGIAICSYTIADAMLLERSESNG